MLPNRAGCSSREVHCSVLDAEDIGEAVVLCGVGGIHVAMDRQVSRSGPLHPEIVALVVRKWNSILIDVSEGMVVFLHEVTMGEGVLSLEHLIEFFKRDVLILVGEERLELSIGCELDGFRAAPVQLHIAN